MSSDADIVVLSLLAEQPRHGYDLDRVIEQRGYRQWTSLARRAPAAMTRLAPAASSPERTSAGSVAW